MAVEVAEQTLYAGLDELKATMRLETLLNTLDFNRDGRVDQGPLGRIMRSASADIDMALKGSAGVYPTFVAPFPEGLVTLALDGMIWRMGTKWPTMVVVDHVAIRKDVMERLKSIRKGEMSLGQEPPDPAANHGGVLLPDPTCNRGPLFSNVQRGRGAWGIF